MVPPGRTADKPAGRRGSETAARRRVGWVPADGWAAGSGNHSYRKAEPHWSHRWKEAWNLYKNTFLSLEFRYLSQPSFFSFSREEHKPGKLPPSRES